MESKPATEYPVPCWNKKCKTILGMATEDQLQAGNVVIYVRTTLVCADCGQPFFYRPGRRYLDRTVRRI